MMYTNRNAGDSLDRSDVSGIGADSVKAGSDPDHSACGSVYQSIPYIWHPGKVGADSGSGSGQRQFFLESGYIFDGTADASEEPDPFAWI